MDDKDKIKLGKCYVESYDKAEVIEVGKRKSLVKVQYTDTVLGMTMTGKARYKIENSLIKQ